VTGQNNRKRTLALTFWLVGMAICALIVSRTTFTTDLSAFLPQSPTKEQGVLLDQLRDGIVARLILTGVEGADAPTRAAISKGMAERLRADPAFVTVNNGEPVNSARDQAFLFGNRYLLSSAVTPERFTVEGMHAALSDSIALLASPAGLMVKGLLPRDPTGELMGLLEGMAGTRRPHLQNGAWASRDGARALLLAQTRATGADIDAQQHAMRQIRASFDAVRVSLGAAATSATLVMTGPGVFAVNSRDTIEREVTRLSIISTLIIVALLLMVYRSFLALALGLMPVISGALVGVVAVSLGFGMVHGITLGFGTTLIGEAVDYSIYLFMQSRAAGPGRAGSSETEASDWLRDFWPTIRLGVLTSIVGFACLLLSSFPGLAQLGLYSIAGLVSAALVTRFVLPHLLPADFRIRDVSAIGARIARLAHYAPLLRWPLALITLLAVLVLIQHRGTLLNPELSSLSPVSLADQATDARLRADIGAPDVRYMVVVSAADSEAALQSAERIAAQLTPLVSQGTLVAFESPSRYLPSIATQRTRQASLPGDDLPQRLEAASAGLPIRATVLQPFLADVAAAKIRAPLQRADMDKTSMALAVDSLLFQRGASWTAVLPLTGPPTGLDAAPIRAALVAAGQPNALFVDLKAESNKLYSGYLREAALLSLGGLAGILVLLMFALRSPMRVARVLLPLVAVVITLVAIFALCGHRMTILHLVGLLLVVAVGSNYALFFSNGDEAGAISAQTLTSLAFANIATVAGFGLLGFSQVPVLQAIGITVGPGAVMALIFAASFGGARSVKAG